MSSGLRTTASRMLAAIPATNASWAAVSEALDDDIARRLWDVSERLTGTGFPLPAGI